MSGSFKQRVLENAWMHYWANLLWKAAKLVFSVCRSPRHVAGDIRSSLPKEICPAIPPCYTLEEAIPCFMVLSADLRGPKSCIVLFMHISLITWMHILI
ncbi:hypothetical protein V6N13_023576 [Hibiscus sabdariffa]|uniref:Uncharacterized protein n=1 Tax=Hibiscus sabdariffa TaxID=183260 RepID=A0ABR2PM89_9ROSI